MKAEPLEILQKFLKIHGFLWFLILKLTQLLVAVDWYSDQILRQRTNINLSFWSSRLQGLLIWQLWVQWCFIVCTLRNPTTKLLFLFPPPIPKRQQYTFNQKLKETDNTFTVHPPTCHSGNEPPFMTWKWFRVSRCRDAHTKYTE